MLELLVVVEGVLCLLLAVAMFQALFELPKTPELELGQRAWTAARFSMAEARALGPLFRHLVRASRHGLGRAHRMQERIRRTREHARGPLRSLWQRRVTHRSQELAELRHLVEQLEQMGHAVARYRAGAGGLMDLRVPMQCLHAKSAFDTRG